MFIFALSFERNIRYMGLLAIYNQQLLGGIACVLPYDQYLKRFPAYLQQLTMESNASTSQWMGRQLTIKPDRSIGRARHQRPAFFIIDPPGNQAHSLRLHRLVSR